MGLKNNLGFFFNVNVLVFFYEKFLSKLALLTYSFIKTISLEDNLCIFAAFCFLSLEIYHIKVQIDTCIHELKLNIYYLSIGLKQLEMPEIDYFQLSCSKSTRSKKVDQNVHHLKIVTLTSLSYIHIYITSRSHFHFLELCKI